MVVTFLSDDTGGGSVLYCYRQMAEVQWCMSWSESVGFSCILCWWVSGSRSWCRRQKVSLISQIQSGNQISDFELEMYRLHLIWHNFICCFRLGIDEELVALLGSHSPVSHGKNLIDIVAQISLRHCFSYSSWKKIYEGFQTTLIQDQRIKNLFFNWKEIHLIQTWGRTCSYYMSSVSIVALEQTLLWLFELFPQVHGFSL